MVKAEESKALVLTEIELWKLKAYEAEAAMYSNAAQIKLLQREALILKTGPAEDILTLTKEAQELRGQCEKKWSQYSVIIGEIEARLNIKIKDFAFDDETGILRKCS
jgi:hypothetical protein